MPSMVLTIPVSLEELCQPVLEKSLRKVNRELNHQENKHLQENQGNRQHASKEQVSEIANTNIILNLNVWKELDHPIDKMNSIDTSNHHLFTQDIIVSPTFTCRVYIDYIPQYNTFPWDYDICFKSNPALRFLELLLVDES